MSGSLEEIFQLQKKYRWQTKQWSVEHRCNLLRLLQQSILEHESEIIAALATDFQKPELEVLMTEIFPVLSEIKMVLKKLKSWASPQRVSSGALLLGTHCEIRSEARGTVLIIAPWNYPFNLAMVPLVSAIAGGNTVILKPSELTPATAQVLQKILSALFEPEFVSVQQGAADVAQKLLAMPFDHIFFTGSTRVGKIVMQAAAEHLSSVTLELGGKSPTIVHSSCDLPLAAKKIVWAKFINAGQTCIAPDVIFVERKILNAFEKLLQEEIKSLWQNRIPVQIITEAHLQRLQNLAETSGGEISSFEKTPAGLRRMLPTIIKDPAPDSALMKEEIFGPIMPLLGFNSLEEPITWIQSRPHPLALYLFAEDRIVLEKVLQQTVSGGVCINDALLHFANHNLPFGGVGESGCGAYHGETGFREMTHQRAVLKQGLLTKAVSFFYPPYQPGQAKLFRTLMKRF